MEVIDAEFQGFEMRRAKIIEHLNDVDNRLIHVEQNKLDEDSAVHSFQEVKNSIRGDKNFAEEIRNDLSTLENYVERYLPLSTLKVLVKLIQPLFEED